MTNCPKCKEKISGKTKFCPSCGSKVGRRSAEEKRSRLTAETKSRKTPVALIVALVAAGILALGGYTIFRPGGQAVTAGGGGANAATGDGTITLPVTDFDDGQAKYYTYDGSGKTIKFFVLKSTDGVIRAAFDACDVCYQSKKGYRQEGSFMVCNNCGQRFTSVRINEVRGGCNPAPLERRIDGGNLVIAVADIVTGARYF